MLLDTVVAFENLLPVLPLSMLLSLLDVNIMLAAEDDEILFSRDREVEVLRSVVSCEERWNSAFAIHE